MKIEKLSKSDDYIKFVVSEMSDRDKKIILNSSHTPKRINTILKHAKVNRQNSWGPFVRSPMLFFSFTRQRTWYLNEFGTVVKKELLKT